MSKYKRKQANSELIREICEKRLALSLRIHSSRFNGELRYSASWSLERFGSLKTNTIVRDETEFKSSPQEVIDDVVYGAWLIAETL